MKRITMDCMWVFVIIDHAPSTLLNSFVVLLKVKRCSSERCSLSCVRYLHVYLHPFSLHAIVFASLDILSLLCCCCMCLYSPERCWYCFAQNWQLSGLFFTLFWVGLISLTEDSLREGDAGGLDIRRHCCVTEVTAVHVSFVEASWEEGSRCSTTKLVGGSDEQVPTTLPWSG